MTTRKNSPLRRMISSILVLAMMTGFFGVIPIQQVHATQYSSVLMTESFEVGEGGSFVANENSGIVTDNSGEKGATPHWNGAEPADSGMWNYWWSGGNSVTLTANIPDGYSGACIQHTANEKNSKQYMEYLLCKNTAILEKMEDGKTYTASIWVKQNETGGELQLKVFNTGDADGVVAALSGCHKEWTKVSVDFIYSKAKKGNIKIGINPQNSEEAGGTVWFDYLMIEEKMEIGESASSKYIVEESFEIGKNFESNTNVDIKSVHTNATVDDAAGDGVVIWNGANPVSGSQISTYFSSGCVTLEGGVTDGYEGSSCIKHTSNQYYNTSGGPWTSSSVYVKYQLNADQTAKMTNGAMYTASVWVKQSSESSGLITLRVTNNGNTDGKQAVRSLDSWQQVKVNFTYDSSKSVTLQILPGHPSNSNETTAVYLDYLTVEEFQEQPDTIEIPKTATVVAGKSVMLNAVVPEGKTAVWRSSDDKVATVNNGVVTGVKAGTATITATVGAASDTCIVTVTAPSNYIVEEGFENPIKNNSQNVVSTSGEATWNLASHTNWSVWTNTASFVLDGICGESYEGSNAIKIIPSGTGRGTALYTLTNEEMARLEVGAEYRISAWAKTDSGTISNFGLELKNAMNADPSIPIAEVGTTWTEISHTFVLERKDSNIRIGVGPKGATASTYYIDKVTLEPTHKATAIALNISEWYLEPTQSIDLEYTLTPTTAISTVEYKSSNVDVATISSDGKVTAVAAGTATITATAVNGKVKASCVIHVVDEYIALSKISLDRETLSMTPGGEDTLKVIFNPENATITKTTWASSDSEVVKVDEKGNLTSVKAGNATITATVDGKTAQCVVTVSDEEGFVSKSQEVTVDFGKQTPIALKDILDGVSYKVVSYPAKGNVYISNDKVYYTSYTWLMDSDGEFIDQTYQDTVKISVKNADGKTATITLNITIDTLANLMNSVETWNLMFTEAEINAVKDEAKTNHTRKKLIEQALAEADSLMNSTPVAAWTSKTYDEDLSQRSTGDIAMAFMMAYLLTKDDGAYAAKNVAYLEKTIYWLKASLSYPFWGSTSAPNNDLACAHQLLAVAMGYHWLKDELENVTCTHALGTDFDSWTVKTTENMPMLEAMEERMWRAGSDLYTYSKNYTVYVMNHLHIRMAGLMAAAVALQSAADKTPEQEAMLVKWMGMGLYKDGYGMNALMPDGTSQEGLPYWEYGTSWVFQGSYVAETALGIDLIGMTNVYSQSAEYVLYNGLPMNEWTSSQNLLNVGDSPTYHYDGPSHLLRMIAAEYKDSTAQWLANIFEEKGIGQNEHVWMSAMFADVDVSEAEPENLETLKWYKDLDHVIARSSWSGNEDVLSIKTGVPCGKNLLKMVQNGSYVGEADAGHAHPDANHVTLYSNGEYLLRDDGYCDKYASNHNTLLVNGKGQLGEGEAWMQEQPYISNNAIPHMEKVEEVVDTENGITYDYIIGDATEAYASNLGLDLFQRHIVYLKEEKILLIVDNIEAVSNTKLELRWFTGSKSALYSGGVYTIKSANNTMNFFPFTYGGVTTTFENVVSYGRDNSTGTEKTFRQTYTGAAWQNAVSFSWAAAGSEAAYVKYKPGANENEHVFGVNGRTYTINVATATVTVSKGDFDSDSGGAANDSSISTLVINGVVYDSFDPATQEYTIERLWKDYDLYVEAASNAYGATVVIDQSNLNQVKITCTSRDGQSSTDYFINIKNSKKILGIQEAQASITAEDMDVASSYDNFIGVADEAPKWTVKSDETGRVLVTYDLGEIVTLEQIDLAIHNSALRDSYYELKISVDNKSWEYLLQDGTVTKEQAVAGAAVGSKHGMVTVYKDEPVQTRYVQVVLRGNSTHGKDTVDTPNGIQEIAFYGLPEGEMVVPQDGYAVAIATLDKYVDVGETVFVTVKVESNEFENFASGEVKLRYDATILEFNREDSNIGSAMVQMDEENGTLALEDYGAIKDFGIAYTLAFTAKTAGNTHITLTEAAISTQEKAAKDDLMSAMLSATTVGVNVTLRHKVTLPEFFTGATIVENGKDYTFTVKNGNLYDYEVTATVGGETVQVIENGDGSYTVKNVTGELIITAMQTPKSFTVTIKEIGEDDRTENATYMTDYVFNIPNYDGYTVSVNVTYSDGKTVPVSSSESTITIAGMNVTGDIIIVVTKTQILPTTAIVTVEGNGAADVTYAPVATPGTDYTFTLTADTKYDYTIGAKNGDKELELTAEDNGNYTISSKDFKAGDTIVITVNKIIRITNVEVKDYLTIDQANVWLIMVKTEKMERGTYTYQNNKMYWSEKYGAYCYLVISVSEAPAICAEDLAIVNETATEVDYGMDVNISGKVDANDAQLVYNIYNAHYNVFTDDVTMEKFLRADINFDGKVNVEDAQVIINQLLS